MVSSVPFNWDEIQEQRWNEPSDEVYSFLRFCKSKSLKKFLDLGCGIGRHSILFAEEGFDVTSYDLSESGIKILKNKTNERLLKIKADIGDMLMLPYNDNSFDCILAYHSIYHTDNVGIERVIDEIDRVLCKDGYAYITFNSKSNPSFKSESNQIIDDNTIIKSEGHEKEIPHYFVNETEIRRLLAQFEIIRFKHIEEIKKSSHSFHYHLLIKSCK